MLSKMSTNFKIAKRYRQAAELINKIPVEKFPQLLSRILKKLHIKGAKLFGEDEEAQLKALFGLTDEDLGLVLDSCCYTFEQGKHLNLVFFFTFEILSFFHSLIFHDLAT